MINPIRANNLKNIKQTNSDKISKLNSGLKRKKDIAYIIGGGPSVKNHDIKSLSKDGDLIVINKAIEHVDKADFFITMDHSFLKHKVDFKIIKAKAETTIFIVNKVNGNIIKNPDGFYYDKRFKIKYEYLKEMNHVIESSKSIDKRTGFGLTFDDFANGENSGYCALQLAILLEYKEIYLLGFDLKVDGKVTHFHEGYKQNVMQFKKNIQKYRYHFIQSFKRLNVQYKNKIKSASKESFLNALIEYKDINSMTKTKEVKVETNKELKDLIIIAYFTVDTPYEEEKEKLVESCKKFGLNYYIKGVKNLGDWQKNTRYKATFVKECLEKFPDKRLLYVDADAIFNHFPNLFIDYNCDIAIRWQDFSWRKNEALSGTIYFENNEKIKKLCDKWIAYNDAEYKGNKPPKTMEQWNLGKVITEMRQSDKLVDKNLPETYCFIFDLMLRMYPNAKPVIEHFQASRRFKRKVNIKK